VNVWQQQAAASAAASDGSQEKNWNSNLIVFLCFPFAARVSEASQHDDEC